MSMDCLQYDKQPTCTCFTTEIGDHCLDTFQSGALAAAFDVGGIIGEYLCMYVHTYSFL